MKTVEVRIVEEVVGSQVIYANVPEDKVEALKAGDVDYFDFDYEFAGQDIEGGEVVEIEVKG